MYSFPMHPDNMSLNELASWAENHDDQYVRYLGSIIARAVEFSPEGWISDPENWFTDMIERSELAERDLEWAEEERDDANNRAERAEEQYKALLLDTDKDEMYYQNNALKARLSEEKERLAAARAENKKLEQSLEDLKQEYKYLNDKHNTWTVLVTPTE